MQENWDKNNIYTLVGYFKRNRLFCDLEGQDYKVTSYRIIYTTKSNGLVAINVKWHPILEEWIIFQLVELGDEDSIR